MKLFNLGLTFSVCSLRAKTLHGSYCLSLDYMLIGSLDNPCIHTYLCAVWLYPLEGELLHHAQPQSPQIFVEWICLSCITSESTTEDEVNTQKSHGKKLSELWSAALRAKSGPLSNAPPPSAKVNFSSASRLSGILKLLPLSLSIRGINTPACSAPHSCPSRLWWP